MSSFHCIKPFDLSFLTFLLGSAIAKNLNSNQQNSVANFLEAVAQQIILINGQQALIEAECEDQPICQEIELLKKQIEILEKKMNMKRY